MNAHEIRQQARQKWLQGKRQRHGPEFLAGDDDGTEDPLQHLIVFGYAARLFARSEPVADDIGLIDLLLSDGSQVLVDRYDVRHLLSPPTIVAMAGSEPMCKLPDPELNEQRFAALAADEEDSCDDPIDAAQPLPLVLKFAVPDGMVVPESQRHFEIIESTAQFISNQPAGMADRMEITIQGRQASNSDFEFLYRASPLHPFYLHLRWLMQTRLYGYNSDSDSEVEPASIDPPEKSKLHSPADPHNNIDPHALVEDTDIGPANGPALIVPDDVHTPASYDARVLIDKVAGLVAKSPEPARLEQKLREEKAAVKAYAFLSPPGELHRYYCFRRDCCINGLDPAIVDDALAASSRQDADSEAGMRNETGGLHDVADVQAKRRRLVALTFDSPEAELEYWRHTTFVLRDRLMDREDALADFQVQSAELEMELEKEISRLEATNSELRAKYDKCNFDLEGLKEKYQRAQLKAGEDLASIERELQFVRSQQEFYKSRTRELEQDNDDLERNERAAKSSMQAMEGRLNRAIEQNSHLMGEVQTKKILVDEVQRLKDELKDLNLELNVVRGRSSRVVPQNGGILRTSTNSGSGADASDQLVNNIMSRVKDLEARLAGARTKVTPLLNASGQYATVHSRAMRSRPIASPKVQMSYSHNGSAESSHIPAPSSRTLSSSNADDPRIPGSGVIQSRLDRARLMRDTMGLKLDEASKQQTVPQRRPVH
ncbi:NADH:ubiquinone oxidoreductase [Coemansia sp. BCRC 34962]|nr:NADH:ubiquinone oxidoreductase [Coemansia sp. BCRC 34962]